MSDSVVAPDSSMISGDTEETKMNNWS